MKTIKMSYSGMEWSRDCHTDDLDSAVKSMMRDHNARPTTKDKNGNQRVIIETPFGNSRGLIVIV